MTTEFDRQQLSEFCGQTSGFPSPMLRTSLPLLSRQRRNVPCYFCKKRVAISATPFFSGVPKGIPFDTAQDKLTPVIPMKIGMPLAEKKAPIRSRPPRFAWRPQGDSNPCCRRERPVSLAGLDDGDAQKETQHWSTGAME